MTGVLFFLSLLSFKLLTRDFLRWFSTFWSLPFFWVPSLYIDFQIYFLQPFIKIVGLSLNLVSLSHLFLTVFGAVYGRCYKFLAWWVFENGIHKRQWIRYKWFDPIINLYENINTTISIPQNRLHLQNKTKFCKLDWNIWHG